MTLSHIDDQNQPRMVNVSGKTTTRRTAVARAVLALPEPIRAHFRNGDIAGPKGPVFQTAVIAGTMAAKRTGDWIPFCHPVGLDRCDIDIRLNADGEVVIDCTCGVEGKTGVEMEALTGATMAALTVYDMCKALSHDIRITDIRLLEKTGGKSDFVSTS